MVARVIFSAIASADGYIEDEGGDFQWAAPDEEVFTFINELERLVGTHLFGRRMYETMLFWETAQTAADQPACVREFQRLWHAADKVVYSTTLEAVSSARTQLQREFDPHTIRDLIASQARDISVGGPGLASHALKAGLVDECHLFVVPQLVGGGKPAFPAGVRTRLELLDQRHFRSGVQFVRYRVGTSGVVDR